MTTTPPTGSDRVARALERYRDVLGAISDAAAAQEARRELPYAHVRELAARGFGALRLPEELGGAGLSPSEFSRVLVGLGTADSNYVQLFRSHFIYVEALLTAPASAQRDRWIGEVAKGALLGGAATERGATNSDRFSTSVTTAPDGRRLLNGTKFYSTGSLYADWVATIAEDESSGEVVHVVVRSGAEGVDLLDDWDGFGQRLTASGTSRFTDVEIESDWQLPETIALDSYATSWAQQFHLAALAGIARDAHRRVTGYVRERRRYFSQGRGELPKDDPVVQAVIGETSSAAYLAETLTEQIGAELDGLFDAIITRTVSPELEDHIELQVYRAQYLVVRAVLDATTRLFDVGGASALSGAQGWDRFWRNARTLASHNPIPYRLTALGDYELNGRSPFRAWFSGTDLSKRTAA
ncbi:acyl-CoA dehydrogenase family protein [Leucobacter weissii]|uniref:Acyl-CoA dehydrogenase family protein n=1 Tax=Leucobacter weissii TaxID=1983706 RepID=A0A939SD87_9MICO|nr:acyl-CoA dehydrogenase family protein [Leucobacter weissii]